MSWKQNLWSMYFLATFAFTSVDTTNLRKNSYTNWRAGSIQFDPRFSPNEKTRQRDKNSTP